MTRIPHVFGALLLLFAALPAWAEQQITLFNLSAAEVERTEAPRCRVFSDQDTFAFVASDRVRTLGAAQNPTWEKEESCKRIYCLKSPSWQANRPEGMSCFTLTISSIYKYICTRGHEPSCHQRTYKMTLGPAPSSGPTPTAVSGEANVLETPLYRISLQKSGAIILADVGRSYRKKGD